MAAAGLELLVVTSAVAYILATANTHVSGSVKGGSISSGGADVADSIISSTSTSPITTDAADPSTSSVSVSPDDDDDGVLTAPNTTATPLPAKCCSDGEALAPGLFCVTNPLQMATLPPGAGNGSSAGAVCEGVQYSKVLPMSERGRAFVLSEDGALLLMGLDSSSAQPLRLESYEFCADRLNATGKEVVVACVCQKMRCVNKCCYSNETLNAPLRENFKCASAKALEVDAEAAAWAAPGRQPPFLLAPGPPPFVVSDKPPSCEYGESFVLLNLYPDQPARSFEVLSDGTLQVDILAEPVLQDRFCVDLARLHDGSLVPNVVYCAGGTAAPPHVAAAFYPALLGCGAFFLLLTLGVYALVPEIGRKPHARALMCHCGAMLLAFATLLPMQLGVLPKTGAVCYVAVLLVQFGMLASFFWLNVLCIDIAWAFRELQSQNSDMRPRRRRLLLCYSMYAWGGAAAVVGTTAVLDAVPSRLPTFLRRPNIAATQCWFGGPAATLLYYYGPMAVLLLANAALFVYTAVVLGAELRRRKSLRQAGDRPHGGDALSRSRDRLAVYLKLFCLMGVVWVTEIISWGEGSDSVVWMVTDAVNALRGVGVFVLFCCKRRVLRKLSARLACLACCWSRCAPADETPSGTFCTDEQSQSVYTLSSNGAAGNANADAAAKRRSAY